MMLKSDRGMGVDRRGPVASIEPGGGGAAGGEVLLLLLLQPQACSVIEAVDMVEDCQSEVGCLVDV